MLAKIIDWSGRNRFLVLLATLFVIVGGVSMVLAMGWLALAVWQAEIPA